MKGLIYLIIGITSLIAAGLPPHTHHILDALCIIGGFGNIIIFIRENLK